MDASKTFRTPETFNISWRSVGGFFKFGAKHEKGSLGFDHAFSALRGAGTGSWLARTSLAWTRHRLRSGSGRARSRACSRRLLSAPYYHRPYHGPAYGYYGPRVIRSEYYPPAYGPPAPYWDPWW